MTATQPGLFDPPAARAARDDAVGLVEQHANQAWLAHARQWVEALNPGRTFTTDDVWAAAAGWDVTTHEPRALGAVLTGCARRRTIRKTGTYRPSARSECHARPIAVWERLP